MKPLGFGDTVKLWEEKKITHLINELMMPVFAERPLVWPGSANKSASRTYLDGVVVSNLKLSFGPNSLQHKSIGQVFS